MLSPITDKANNRLTMSNENTQDNFSGWLEELENAKQPTCNVDSPEDCDSCGS